MRWETTRHTEQGVSKAKKGCIRSTEVQRACGRKRERGQTQGRKHSSKTLNGHRITRRDNTVESMGKNNGVSDAKKALSSWATYTCGSPDQYVIPKYVAEIDGLE